jgi:hypothetical protein
VRPRKKARSKTEREKFRAATRTRVVFIEKHPDSKSSQLKFGDSTWSKRKPKASKHPLKRAKKAGEDAEMTKPPSFGWRINCTTAEGKKSPRGPRKYGVANEMRAWTAPIG